MRSAGRSSLAPVALRGGHNYEVSWTLVISSRRAESYTSWLRGGHNFALTDVPQSTLMEKHYFSVTFLASQTVNLFTL